MRLSSEQENLGDWMLSLVHGGRQEELLAVDASSRSKLGGNVEAWLRTLQLLEDHKQQKGIFAGALDSRQQLRDASLAVVNLATSFTKQNGISTSVPGLDEARSAIVLKLGEKVKEFTAGMAAAKKTLAPVYEEI